jgi:predicted ribosome quality control (RQC) complex YloA/Tae2 family protein
MPFDALTLAAVRQELQTKVVGGRIQNLLLPGPLTVSLEIYKAGVGRTHLILSAHPQHARVHLVGKSPSRDPEQHPPLLLLLRKYVRGGTLLDVIQPRNERVLLLSIAKRLRADQHQEYHSEGDFRDTGEEDGEYDEDESAPVRTVELVAEIMGRVSNIVLVDEDGSIMESIKRVPSSINRYRVTLPHYAYVAPPPQEKRDPLHTTINALALEIGKAAAEDAKAAAWKGLVSGYAAISPTLSREVVHRALGDTSVKATEVANRPELLARVLEQMQALLSMEQAGSWQPSIAVRGSEGGDARVLDFAPYQLSHLEAQGATLEPYESISEAATRYFDALGNLGGHSALKAQIAADLAEMRSRDERKLHALREEWQRAQALEELRRKGEMLYAYMHLIEPGQRSLSIPEENLTIQLDPGMSPVENAQAIFKEYRKARSAVEGLPERIAASEVRLSYLDELATSLELASTYDDIRAVQIEIKAAGQPTQSPEQAAQPKGKGKNKKQPQTRLPQPARLQTANGVQILLGRTASQNDTATFRLATPDDLWFHARNVPGSHVILRAVPNLTDEDVEEAARLAAGFSRARENAQVDVIYTERKHVRKIPNAPPGLVTYKNERVIRVEPKRKT